MFGGQVIAQALQAAQRSTDAPKQAHSLHAYFMRPGDEAYPILYRVVRDFDGKSFSTRRVIATQRGVPILNLACSLQAPEGGLAHQDAMPDVPPPEDLASDRDIRQDPLPGQEPCILEHHPDGGLQALGLALADMDGPGSRPVVASSGSGARSRPVEAR